MNTVLKELTPIQYSSAAIKVLHFEIQPHLPCFRLHWHDRMEILRIKQGKMCVEYGTQTAIVSAGDLLIVPPQMPHTGYTMDQMVVYEVLMFDVRSFYNETEICQLLLPAIFDGRAVLKNVVSDVDTIRCFDAICEMGDQNSLETTAKVYQLLHLFFQNNLLELRGQPKTAPIKHIIDYVEQNFDQEINTASLCDAFGYTVAHFCRKFKKVTGLTPMVYLKIYRLEQACKKIKHTDASIGEIASECGFSDANYFTRCFKAHFGVPPTYYRKQ